MIKNDVTLPNIPHSTITLNAYGRANIKMDDGWVFWQRTDYIGEDGLMYEPAPEEIMYSRAIYNISLTYNFDEYFVVVDESTVDQSQIFSLPSPPTEKI